MSARYSYVGHKALDKTGAFVVERAQWKVPTGTKVHRWEINKGIKEEGENFHTRESFLTSNFDFVDFVRITGSTTWFRKCF